VIGATPPVPFPSLVRNFTARKKSTIKPSVCRLERLPRESVSFGRTFMRAGADCSVVLLLLVFACTATALQSPIPQQEYPEGPKMVVQTRSRAAATSLSDASPVRAAASLVIYAILCSKPRCDPQTPSCAAALAAGVQGTGLRHVFACTGSRCAHCAAAAGKLRSVDVRSVAPSSGGASPASWLEQRSRQGSTPAAKDAAWPR